MVHVEMTTEEFQEFMAWKKDKACYEKELGKVHRKADTIADKVLNAIEPDSDKEGYCKVADEDHLSELYEMALEW